ncbi:MAG: hypothetical protein ABJ349_14010, partial [Hyphomicrobiales bacterium]
MNKAIVGILGIIVGGAGGYLAQDGKVKETMGQITELTEKVGGLEGLVGESKTAMEAGEASLAEANAALEAATAEATSAKEAVTAAETALAATQAEAEGAKAEAEVAIAAAKAEAEVAVAEAKA